MTTQIHAIPDVGAMPARGKSARAHLRQPAEKAFEAVAKAITATRDAPQEQTVDADADHQDDTDSRATSAPEPRTIPHFLLASHVQSTPVAPVARAMATAPAPRSSTPATALSHAGAAGVPQATVQQDMPKAAQAMPGTDKKPRAAGAEPAKPAPRNAGPGSPDTAAPQASASPELTTLTAAQKMPSSKVDTDKPMPKAVDAESPAKPDMPTRAQNRSEPVAPVDRKADQDDAAPILTILKMPEPPAPAILPPVRQVADAIVPAVSNAQSILRLIADQPDAQPVIRTLQIGLQPKDLGQIRLTLKLGSEGLDLRVEAESAEAARSLEQDKSLLGRMLQDAGVAVPAINIDVRVGRFEPQATPTDTRASWLQSDTPGNGQGAGFAQRDRSGQSFTEANTSSPVRGSRHETEAADPGRSRGVYL